MGDNRAREIVMINVTLGFTLSDRKFDLIPKFYNISKNKEHDNANAFC